ncbi:MAG: hypothetical protein SFU91_12550 [Chloroherpetonaceae bacterium]|nr:hypothetical protein [Chloroherpetonaceae bacterium]
MKKFFKKEATVLAIVLFSFGLAGCLLQSDDIFTQTITTSGKVVLVSSDSVSFYGLQSDNGQNYYPDSLENQYRINNLRVTFSGRVRFDIENNWGLFIELTSVRTGN